MREVWKHFKEDRKEYSAHAVRMNVEALLSDLVYENRVIQIKFLTESARKYHATRVETPEWDAVYFPLKTGIQINCGS